MKFRYKIEVRKETIGIALGFLAAFGILFSQSLYYHYLDNVDGVSSIELTDENGDEIPVLTMTQHAVSSFAQISINQTLDFISDVIVNKDVEENELPKTLRLDGYFNTLFNLIISPNAP